MEAQAQLDLREALKLAAASLKGAQVPFALIGSYAPWAWGGPEPDHDVDFLVARQDASEAAQALGDNGFTVVQPAVSTALMSLAGAGYVVPLQREGLEPGRYAFTGTSRIIFG